MAYRNGNYSAFYVKEPFAEGNLWSARDQGLRVLQSAKGMERRRQVVSIHRLSQQELQCERR